MDDLPQYSSDALLAKDMFLCDYVSLIFYCEDADHESVYERLVWKLIPNINEFAVVCLGGKTELIKKSKESPLEGVQRIFIADKDYDDLLGKVYSCNGFYYLNRACLENFLIDIDILQSICIEVAAPKLTQAACTIKLSEFNAFYAMLKASYEKVTRIFIVVQKYQVNGVQSTKISIDELLFGASQHFPLPTDEWRQNYRETVQSKCAGHNAWLECDQAFDHEVNHAFDVPNQGALIATNDEDHLNGKHLFRCVLRYLKDKLEVDLEDLGCQRLYLRIIDSLNLSPLFSLRDQILLDFPDIVIH